ncbi:40364_t:CDS:2 [Gigaspora margarita]|uniref:40364_t:CDS:1 n=1 Tax=Gigaspora margarita TaxID=4874 RepID=A0ABN7VQL7_GIGMA|nr:40364_t:CDS:2 [Gigaspora margarita]
MLVKVENERNKRNDENKLEAALNGKLYTVHVNHRQRKIRNFEEWTTLNASFYQNGIGLEKVYEDRKKGVNRFLRQIDNNSSKNRSEEVYKETSAVLEPKGLVLDLVKNYSKKTLVEVGLEMTRTWYLILTEKANDVDQKLNRQYEASQFGIGIKSNIEHDTAYNLEHACKVWKKKVKRLKKVTRKSENKELNELKKHEKFKYTILNPIYEA